MAVNARIYKQNSAVLLEITGLSKDHAYTRYFVLRAQEDGGNVYEHTYELDPGASEVIYLVDDTHIEFQEGKTYNCSLIIKYRSGGTEDNPIYSETSINLGEFKINGDSGGSSEGDSDYIPNIESFTADILDDGRITVSFRVSNLIGNYFSNTINRESEVDLFCNGKIIDYWYEDDKSTINETCNFSPDSSDVYEIYIYAFNNKYNDETGEKIGYGEITSKTIILEPEEPEPEDDLSFTDVNFTSNSISFVIKGTVVSRFFQFYINGQPIWDVITFSGLIDVEHTIDSLNPNTKYTIELFADGDMYNSVISYTFTTLSDSHFSWTWAGIKRNDNGTYQVVKGKTKGENGAIYFYLTADEWNSFTKRINSVRLSKGLAEFGFTQTNSSGIAGRNVATDADNLNDNQKVSADIINEAVVAINEMGTSIETVSSGDRVEVEFFNKLVNELNTIS